MMVDPSIVETYNVGKEGFIVALCEALGVPALINTALSSPTGRPEEIPYGVLAMMMMVNMCDDHHPVYRLKEYYEDKDIEGLFHHPISLEQINDDRFGGFLDLFHKAGCRRIFSQIAVKAITLYGIQIKNINFDTTSKVMWGDYETPEGTLGVIKMDFGHSKDKRNDKKQIKYGIGCAEGIVVDAEVLSGNKDDKTYNLDTLKKLDKTLDNLNVSKENFYYIADSALFTKDNLTVASEKNIKLITRMPDNILEAKAAIKQAADQLPKLKVTTIQNARGEILTYRLIEKTCEYKNHPLRLVVCYSESLIGTKERTVIKAVGKEAEVIAKLAKTFVKREFACKEDALNEIDKIKLKDLKKVKYHDITFEVKSQERRRRGRPSQKDAAINIQGYRYYLEIQSKSNADRIQRAIEENCCFVLCSNDLALSAEDLLKEYKTQDSVEKKFKQLKSPQFVNAIYLESPERIEAFSYLMLICMLILSVAEYVVRRGLTQDNDQIIGPGKVKMKRPTQRAIYDTFYSVRIRVICHPNKPWERSFVKPLKDAVKKVLKYLQIPENTFIRGST